MQLILKNINFALEVKHGLFKSHERCDEQKKIDHALTVLQLAVSSILKYNGQIVEYRKVQPSVNV
jgi:hypothetical protein